MKGTRLSQRSPEGGWIPLKITLFYGLIGTLWILFSDKLLAALVADPAQLTRWQTYKGWLYVLLTAGALYVLIRRSLLALGRSREALDKVQRAYKTLSAGNQAMLHATTEEELLRNVCQAIVRDGGYRLAWVGFAEQDEGKTVRPVAHAGYEEGYLDTLALTWADAEGGRGPTGTAIRSRQPSVAKHIPTDPAFETRWAEAHELDYASSVALPLLNGGRAFGALNVYAAEADAFGEEEIGLLSEMSGDLAYGLIALRTRAERERAQKALRASEARLRSTLDNMLEGAQIIGFDWRYLYVNDAVARQGRQAKDELLGHTMMDRYPGIEDTEMFAVLRRCMEERTAQRMENEFTYPDGSKRWFELSVEPVPEGIFILSLDITERKRAEAEIRQLNKELEQRVRDRTEDLRRARDRAEAILNSVGEALMLVKPDGRIQQVNSAFQTQTGYTAQEIELGHHKDLLLDGGMPRDVFRESSAAMRAGQGWRGEMPVRRKDGTSYDAAVTITPLRSPG